MVARGSGARRIRKAELAQEMEESVEQTGDGDGGEGVVAVRVGKEGEDEEGNQDGAGGRRRSSRLKERVIVDEVGVEQGILDEEDEGDHDDSDKGGDGTLSKRKKRHSSSGKEKTDGSNKKKAKESAKVQAMEDEGRVGDAQSGDPAFGEEHESEDDGTDNEDEDDTHHDQKISEVPRSRVGGDPASSATTGLKVKYNKAKANADVNRFFEDPGALLRLLSFTACPVQAIRNKVTSCSDVVRFVLVLSALDSSIALARIPASAFSGMPSSPVGKNLADGIVNAIDKAVKRNQQLSEHDSEAPVDLDYVSQQHPLLEKKAVGNRVRSNLSRLLIGVASDLLDSSAGWSGKGDPPAVATVHWIAHLSGSSARSVRMSATMVGYSLISGWTDAYAKLNSAAEGARKSLEGVGKRRGPKAHAGDGHLASNFDVMKAKIVIAKNVIEQGFNSIFAHRYRDLPVPELRALSVRSLGEWCCEHPDVFLDDQHIKYLGWTLSDQHPSVRIAALTSLQKLYQHPEYDGRLSGFTQRFSDRILEASLDQDLSCAIAAVQVCWHLLRFSVLSEDKIRQAALLVVDERSSSRELNASVAHLIALHLFHDFGEDESQDLRFVEGVDEGGFFLYEKDVPEDDGACCRSLINFGLSVTKMEKDASISNDRLLSHLGQFLAALVPHLVSVEALMGAKSGNWSTESQEVALLLVIGSLRRLPELDVGKKKKSVLSNFSRKVSPRLAQLLNSVRSLGPALTHVLTLIKYLDGSVLDPGHVSLVVSRILSIFSESEESSVWSLCAEALAKLAGTDADCVGVVTSFYQSLFNSAEESNFSDSATLCRMGALLGNFSGLLLPGSAATQIAQRLASEDVLPSDFPHLCFLATANLLNVIADSITRDRNGAEFSSDDGMEISVLVDSTLRALCDGIQRQTDAACQLGAFMAAADLIRVTLTRSEKSPIKFSRISDRQASQLLDGLDVFILAPDFEIDHHRLLCAARQMLVLLALNALPQCTDRLVQCLMLFISVIDAPGRKLASVWTDAVSELPEVKRSFRSAVLSAIQFCFAANNIQLLKQMISLLVSPHGWPTGVSVPLVVSDVGKFIREQVATRGDLLTVILPLLSIGCQPNEAAQLLCEVRDLPLSDEQLSEMIGVLEGLENGDDVKARATRAKHASVSPQKPTVKNVPAANTSVAKASKNRKRAVFASDDSPPGKKVRSVPRGKRAGQGPGRKTNVVFEVSQPLDFSKFKSDRLRAQGKEVLQMESENVSLRKRPYPAAVISPDSVASASSTDDADREGTAGLQAGVDLDTIATFSTTNKPVAASAASKRRRFL